MSRSFAVFSPYGPPHQNQNQEHVVYLNQESGYVYDNSACLYCSAISAIFFPLIGLITILIYSCGCMQRNRSQREKTAFVVLLITTFTSIILGIIIFINY